MLNKNMFRLVSFFSVLVLAVVVLGSANKAEAYTRTAAVTGPWGDFTTWGAPVPTASDDVVIPDNIVVTVDVAAVANTIAIADAATGINGITISGTNSLTVTGDITMTAQTVNDSTLAVGAGTLSANDIFIPGGAVGGVETLVSVSTGTITVTDSFVLTGTAAQSKLTSTGASDINIAGNLTGGTLTTSGTGTITFNGAGAQTIGSFTTYNDVVINKSGGTASLGAGGTTTFGGTLTVTAGTLATVDNTFTVTGASSVTGTITFTTGAKVFTGDVTLNSGAVWTESGASTYTFGGNFTNNATTFTASTGLHTFNGATTKTISGSTTTDIDTVTISTGNHANSGTLVIDTLTVTGAGILLTNTGTITASLSLTGTGGLTQGTGGVLNIGDAVDITAFDASTNVNTINYTKAGPQTVLDMAEGTAHHYSSLGLSGSGVKTLNSAAVVDANLTIGGTATANLTGTAYTANKLYFGTTLQRSGIWGSTAATATFENDTRFDVGGTGEITVATGASSGNSSNSQQTTITTYPDGNTPSTLSNVTTPATPATPATEVVSCPTGHSYSATSGKKCTDWTTVGSPAQGYAFGNVLVKLGSKGGACKAWQMFLNDKAGANLATDGACGKLTMAAARAWQSANGLVADGLLGAKSRAKATAQ